MQQLTILIDDSTLDVYKRYAQQHGLALEHVIQSVLDQGASSASNDWLEECFRLMDQAGADSSGKRFHREDVYDA